MRFGSRIATVVVVLLCVQLVAQQQSPKPQGPPSNAAPAQAKEVKPSDLIEEWFIRWNELDGTPEKAAHLVELYSPDAMQLMGPGADQIGTLSFTGEAKLKAMAELFGKTYSAITFRINQLTLKEKTAKLVPVTEAPWGGVSAAVELTGAYTDRATK